MTLAFAVDASYSVADTGIMEHLKDQKVELFIQCLWTGLSQPGPRVTNLRLAHDMYLPTAGYISLNVDFTGPYHMESGRAGVPDDLWDAMQFIAVDVELPGVRVVQVEQAAEWVMLQGKQPIIYTSWNAWNHLTRPSNSSRLSAMGVPLWNAYWDGAPDIDFPKLRYGGWRDEDVWIEQWSGGTDMELFVDRNTFVEEKVFGEEPDMKYLSEAEARVAGLFLNAAAKALAKQELTEEEKNALVWLLTQ